MSEHSVLIRFVTNVANHPNADKLDIIKLEGINYTIISQKGSYKVGDKALFFPDSVILPQWLVDEFQLSYLKNNTVKPTKIRGIVSQALILPLDSFYSKLFESNPNYITLDEFLWEVQENQSNGDYDYSGVLGVTRKEEVLKTGDGKTKGNLPSGVEKYDLENAERYPFLFTQLEKENVLITEKLEGTNFAVHVTDEGVEFCSRNLTKSDGIYNILPVKFGIDTFAKLLKEKFNAIDVTIRGEIIGHGIQGNIYNLNEQKCYVFDIKVNGEYLSSRKCQEFCNEHNILHVPVVFFGQLNHYAKDVDELKELSNGKSKLHDTLREGIVIKSFENPRVVFKQRSPDYLSQ